MRGKEERREDGGSWHHFVASRLSIEDFSRYRYEGD